MLTHDRVVPLNRYLHRRLRIRATRQNAGFAAGLNSVPIATAEFASAAGEYAIVFAKLANGEFLPAVLVGLGDEQNLYLDENLGWRRGYVPAFLRQYPFVLAEDRDSGTVRVCLDMAYEGWSEHEGEALFGEDGADTERLTRAMGFLRDLHDEFKRTALFAARLKELDLLEEKLVRSGTGEHARTELNGVYAVSEDKLAQLDEKQLPELFRSGALGLIYTHLLSLRNLERLAELARQEQAAQAAQAAGAMN